MNRISSRLTFFFKRLFPLFLFAILAIAVFATVQTGGFEGSDVFLATVGIAILTAFIVLRTLIWDLADAVYDGGEFLLVRKGGEEERIPLSTITGVRAFKWMNPPRVTLTLSQPGRFGNEIAFLPRFRFGFPFANYTIAQELLDRTPGARAFSAGISRL